ncbi:hypothetical protein LO763_25615 [Glycomyces sp. A-F 0318]|uniref:hypothetical protein n=1 Tax=Glycomyces amatae TaxID=2881355 RepID=UPI001E2A357F|nr:hypothetical protein [Glycomyces amatae]MCD0447000.1 hypothetical protein [Glycomyces amatae]
MTSSGGRSALNPDLVPLHQRLRALQRRYPDGPFPGGELKALQDDAARPRPGSRQLIPDRPGRFRDNREARRNDRRAARGTLKEILQAAASGSPGALARLCEQMRGIQNHRGLRLKYDDDGLGLQSEAIRTVALHLLRHGATQLEVMTGLDLLGPVAIDEDTDLLRSIALLQGDYGYAAAMMLSTCSHPGRSLHWLAVRSSPTDQTTYTDALGKLATKDAEALLEELGTAASMELLRMMSFRSRTPTWMKGNRRLAVALALAAKQPDLFGQDLPRLVAITQVRDDLLYGHSAFLDLTPKLRAAIARDLLAALKTSRAGALIAAALARDPHDGEAIWLHRYIERADDEDGDFPPGLAIRIAVPAPSTGEEPRTHLLADGVPVVTDLFGNGVPDRPERLLHQKQGLRTRTEPYEVRLAEADCAEGCCGALVAHVSTDEAGRRVLWEVKATHGGTDSTRFAFDADAYDAEVERAVADRSWEWSAHRAARLLDQRLRDDPELLARWDCRLAGAVSWSSDRTLLKLLLWHPEPPNRDRPWLQFQHQVRMPDTVVIDDDAVAAAVEALLERLRTTDPTSFAAVCGGSREHAETLGHPWPPSR